MKVTFSMPEKPSKASRKQSDSSQLSKERFMGPESFFPVSSAGTGSSRDLALMEDITPKHLNRTPPPKSKATTSLSQTKLSEHRSGGKRANSTNLSGADREKLRSRLSNTLLGSSKDVKDINPQFVDKNYLIEASLQGDNPYLTIFKDNQSMENFDIKYLTLDQYYVLMTFFSTKKLPPADKMFPWLHGIHRNNRAQIEFIRAAMHMRSLIPNFEVPRDLRDYIFCRSAPCSGDIIANSGMLLNSLEPREILTAWEGSSKLELKIFLKGFLSKIKMDASFLSLIIDDCYNLKVLPLFLELDPVNTISLRNVGIQCSKISHISDIFCYCLNDDHLQPNSENCSCESLARLVRLAQMYKKTILQDLQDCRYRSYILPRLNINELVEQKLMALVPVDSSDSFRAPGHLLSSFDILNFNNWDADYLYKESLELSKMSAATEIKKGLWIGNLTDFHSLQTLKAQNQDFNYEQEHLKHGQLFQPHPKYFDERNTIVSLTSNDILSVEDEFNLIPFPRANWRIFIHCKDGNKFPNLEQLEILFDGLGETEEEDIIIDFPNSGSVSIGDCSEQELVAVVNLCKYIFLKTQLTGAPVLLFCSDGYTESSLLVVSLLTYLDMVSVDQTIINLHKEYFRPCFLFESDYIFLKKIEPLLTHFSPRGMPVDSISKTMVTVSSLASIFLKSSSLKLNDSLITKDVCFNLKGSLPSRILPHLYLGSLNHANDLPLLNELGITRIVGVGEWAEWMTYMPYTQRKTHSGCSILSLSHGAQTPDGIPSMIKQMLAFDIKDDGVGTLTETINDALDFIQTAYEQNEKVLVHCQVGVSRSASLCIAEVMKRLNVSLPRAYLYVRVRRLNVIIQPNLRLLYELYTWEETFVESQIRDFNRITKGERWSRERSESIESTTSSVVSRVSLATTDRTSIGMGSTSSRRNSFKPQSFRSEMLLVEEQDEPDNVSTSVESPLEINDPHGGVILEPSISSEDGDAVHVKDYPTRIKRNVPDYFLRETSWQILCREIHSLNSPYIQTIT
ncbi:BA75_02604T0 [Komagataella pastoris]|uniref:BA75_02604T0 n=1 Tax=Komagataella pastoris TaxID=4922 RepID=A0A1B2JEQ8_PICPA|nr:BA75_02604T0 [Komagataella pastoris]